MPGQEGAAWRVYNVHVDKPSESSIARRALRQQLLAARSALPAGQRAHLDTLLCQQLLQVDLLQSAANIGVFSPIRDEPDLSAAYAQWRAEGRRLSLPVVTGRDNPLSFHAWDAATPLREAAFGVLVPDTTEVVVPDVLIIPCVGFQVSNGPAAGSSFAGSRAAANVHAQGAESLAASTFAGSHSVADLAAGATTGGTGAAGEHAQGSMPYRLGYGGGFYDRTLAAHPFPTVGVAYDQAETVSLTLMAWDRPLSRLVTPSRCIVAMASPRLKR